MEQTLITIELKYCERCGGLFYRREFNPQVYCVTCQPLMAKVAVAQKKPPRSVKAVGMLSEAACV
ncbi:MAG TPA: hypothetical protein VFP40_00910 [Terriglobales bacterium]|jgi:hypothetical protein|nr:hypothetical protein [Terriglobales bacterium]